MLEIRYKLLRSRYRAVLKTLRRLDKTPRTTFSYALAQAESWGETLTQAERQTDLSLFFNTSKPVTERRTSQRALFRTHRFNRIFDFYKFTRTANFVTGGSRVSYGWLGKGEAIDSTFKRRAMTRHISDIARRT